MPDLLACPLSADNNVLSPGVGLCRSASGEIGENQIIGTLTHFGRTHTLIIPRGHFYRNVFQNPAWVTAGTVIAVPIHSTPLPHTSPSILPFLAPADGFVSWMQPDGSPFLHTNDIVRPNRIIAILEFMKIRIDIAFDFPTPARFIRYACLSGSSVRKNDIIAEFASIS